MRTREELRPLVYDKYFDVMDSCTEKQREILSRFMLHLSPLDEESYYKGIHIQNLPLFKKHFRGLFKYRPRGGKYYIQNKCTMKDAKTFAVYKRDVRATRRYWVA
jgi:hypothetical protein